MNAIDGDFRVLFIAIGFFAIIVIEASKYDKKSFIEFERCKKCDRRLFCDLTCPRCDKKIVK